MSILICLVPGMPGVWFRSDARQLGIGLVFASLFNLALVGTFLWPNWLANWLVIGLWCVLACLFATCIFYNFSRSDSWTGSNVDAGEQQRKLVLAQEQYLRGDYFDAEAILHRILSSGENDIEAGMLLISVHRRTQRWKSAFRMLERLELLDGSQKWRFEIHRERKLIEQAQAEENNRGSDESGDDLDR